MKRKIKRTSPMKSCVFSKMQFQKKTKEEAFKECKKKLRG